MSQWKRALLVGPLTYEWSDHRDFQSGEVKPVFDWEFLIIDNGGLIRRKLRFRAETRAFTVITPPRRPREQEPSNARRLIDLYSPAAVRMNLIPGRKLIDKLRAALPKEEVAHITAVCIQRR